MRTFAAILMTCVLVGCAQTETYQVTLVNKTSGPITFGLVKQGEPFEIKWAPPDVAATYGAQPDPEMWGSIAAGKTAVSQPEKGRFGRNSGAYLRVYEGKLDLAGVMAVSRGSSTRADILLMPGQNHVTATIENGKFVAARDETARAK